MQLFFTECYKDTIYMTGFLTSMIVKVGMYTNQSIVKLRVHQKEPSASPCDVASVSDI